MEEQEASSFILDGEIVAQGPRQDEVPEEVRVRTAAREGKDLAQEARAAHTAAREVKVTHPDKVLFPRDGFTKADLVDYYRRIAPRMLPHLRGRPLVMQRFPDGIEHEGFFQKAVANYYPDWIETVVVKKEGGTVEHVLCNDSETLQYVANQGCVTPHIWLSLADKLDFPDRMVFDLDPSGDDFAGVTAAAQSLKAILDGLGLPAYLSTTGSRGLHISVPLDRGESFESVREFSRELASIAVAEDPENRTMEPYRNKRGGRLFLDINRNGYAQTVVAPYAVRARDGAPVSVPLEWGELHKKSLRPDGFTIRTVFDRPEKAADPWKDFWKKPASLDLARRRRKGPNAAGALSKERKVR